jgi:hypothetical protein
MTSQWSQSVDPVTEALRATLDALPSKLTWEATVHYYRAIHRGEPFRMLVIDTFNWQVGRHVYFVPVHFASECEGIVRRHLQDKSGSKTEISALHWSEFERRYPRPGRVILEAAL